MHIVLLNFLDTQACKSKTIDPFYSLQRYFLGKVITRIKEDILYRRIVMNHQNMIDMQM